jgi:proteasome lid subunit RPN8/RPN11
MTFEIELTSNIRDELIQHAKSDLPNECCGYITGHAGVCKTVHKMTNIDASPTYFEFDPKEQFQVVKAARKANEVPVVVYHSHPGSPARLSEKDLELLNDPEMTYLIISLENNCTDLKAYRIINDEIHDVKLNIKEANNVS